jgi:hypothetical protein
MAKTSFLRGTGQYFLPYQYGSTVLLDLHSERQCIIEIRVLSESYNSIYTHKSSRLAQGLWLQGEFRSRADELSNRTLAMELDMVRRSKTMFARSILMQK